MSGTSIDSNPVTPFPDSPAESDDAPAPACRQHIGPRATREEP